jgi:hypothetical protein
MAKNSARWALVAAVLACSQPVLADALKMRPPKPGVWEFYHIFAKIDRERGPQSREYGRPCTLVIRSMEANQFLDEFERFMRPANNEQQHTTILVNTPSRLLGVHSSRWPILFAKLRHWEGEFSTVAIEIKKISNTAYSLTETTTTSRFNVWVGSTRETIKARWISPDFPPLDPDAKIIPTVHGYPPWHC